MARTGGSRLREAINWLNLSTLLGLVIAVVGGARPRRDVAGTWLAPDFRYRFPVASAFTLGDVIVSRHSAAWLHARPELLAHERRHCLQYACFLGPVMLLPYVVGVAASWVWAADTHSLNPFERWAGLADGGYPPPRRRGRGRL